MIKRWAKQTGFTIVELLIVIVVIAILAVIAIVAYNGIQGRAQAAAVSSALEQTNKKLAIYAVDNSAYPPDLATVGINNSSGTSYQYYVNNSTSPQTYCVTATNGTTSYSATQGTIPASGDCGAVALVAEWKFNGNANDSTSNGHNGTVVGAILTNGKDGGANGAYSFNGVDQYINYGNSTAFNSSDITFTSWVKPNVVTGLQEIMAKEMQYKYRLNGINLDILISANGTSWAKIVTAPANFSAGSWYNVAVTVSSSTNTVVAYVNGVQIGSYSLGTSITAFNGMNLYAGTHLPNGEMMNGSIDDMRVYNRALSSTEIQAIYTNPSF